MEILGAIIALAYVFAAWKHMRVRHNERCFAIKLLHLVRMLVFLAMVILVVETEPALASAVFILAVLNVIVWHVDDGLAIRGGRASENPTTQAFKPLHMRTNP